MVCNVLTKFNFGDICLNTHAILEDRLNAKPDLLSYWKSWMHQYRFVKYHSVKWTFIHVMLPKWQLGNWIKTALTLVYRTNGDRVLMQSSKTDLMQNRIFSRIESHECIKIDFLKAIQWNEHSCMLPKWQLEGNWIKTALTLGNRTNGDRWSLSTTYTAFLWNLY